MMSVRTVPKGALVYVIGSYPLNTTTFIDREIAGLIGLGIDVQVVAVRRPPPALPLSTEQRELQKRVTYLLPIVWRRLLPGHLSFALRRPRRYFGTLLYVLTRPHPNLRSRFKTLLHFGEGVYAASLVSGGEFRELHAHFADRAATMALVAARLLEKSYSLSLHAGADIFVDPRLLREKIVAARHVVTCTSQNKTHVASLVGRDLAETKISHIPHGLDTARYQRSSRAAERPPLILAVAQLKERKGLAQLIRACRVLCDRGYDFRCRIVGDGSQRGELERLIRRLFLRTTVTLSGALPHDEVIDQYRRASLFVLPCIKTAQGDVDGIPNALAEAMALQLPVVSTRLPGVQELVSDGVNGILVAPGDPAALASAIGRLLDDPDLCTRLGYRARETIIEKFELENNVTRFARTLWPGLLPEAADRVARTQR